MRFVVLIVIIAAAVVAGLGMMWISGNQTSSNTPAVAASGAAGQGNGSVATVDVLVARTDIPVGTTITASMVDKQPWPRNLVLDGFVTEASGGMDVVGMVARGDIKAREPLLRGKLAKQEEPGFLAASLSKGMRAVTVAVDSVSGVAGFLFPGDHVDVLLTHSLPQQAGELMSGSHRGGGAAVGGMGGQQSATTSEVLLPNIKVLAVNVRKTSGLSDVASRLPMADTEAPGNVTLEMSQDDAKRIRLAEKNGTLSLALRSLQDIKDNNAGSPVTLFDLSHADGDVSAASEKEPESAPMPRTTGNDVMIIRGVMEDSPSMGQSAPPMGQGAAIGGLFGGAAAAGN